MAEEAVKDPSNTAVRTYTVRMGATPEAAVDVGCVDEPELVSKPDLKPITVSHFGSTRLGDRAVGREIHIKFKLREITLANLKRQMPWGSAEAGWAVCPPNGVDIYTYAQAVVLHPDDAADASEDIIARKAAPVTGVNLKGDGEKDATIDFDLVCYPDRGLLPDLVDVYVGSAGV